MTEHSLSAGVKMQFLRAIFLIVVMPIFAAFPFVLIYLFVQFIKWAWVG